MKPHRTQAEWAAMAAKAKAQLAAARAQRLLPEPEEDER